MYGYAGVKKRRRFKFIKQLESLDCAPACLKMVLEHYGASISLQDLRELCKTNKLGTSVYSLITGAEKLGLEAVATKLTINSFTDELPLPAVLLWNKIHFVVLVDIKRGRTGGDSTAKNEKAIFKIADPGFGVLKLSAEDFSRKWADDSGQGMAVFFEPSSTFPTVPSNPNNRKESRLYLRELFKLILKFRLGLGLILFGMLASSFISLAFPIITQRVVDIGIKYKSYQFITLALTFQIGLFLSMTFIDAVKAWLVLYLGSKIEINLTYDFLVKVMKLPLYFFDSKLAGDLMQRISDNSRIQNFIKSQLLDFLIAIANLITLTFMILRYSQVIFFVFFGLSIFAVGWALVFIRKREALDYRRFDVNTENTDNLIETIVAMPEIKINNAEVIKRNKWKEIQFKIFEVNTKLLRLQQYQNSGSTAINYLKNIFVTFLSAQQVIGGTLTIGEMIGLSVIVGQLNVPILQLVSFFQNAQDANISFRRLSEIQQKENEDAKVTIDENDAKLILDDFKEISFKDLYFSYYESMEDLVFNDLSLEIPKGKTTAIVGTSGSGKTTLLKLLLKFYQPLSGGIFVNETSLDSLPSDEWRRRCGVVLQEGFIFTDTIERNICLSTEIVDRKRLEDASEISCINEFVGNLPMGFDTKIGAGGMGLSTGQKQRILIARAVYKDPEFVFFDEATSSLDANNERRIYENLNRFLKNKTSIIIAHRLSTVRNADKIIVLEAGKIVEQGTHEHLIGLQGAYYSLIKNQLELGS